MTGTKSSTPEQTAILRDCLVAYVRLYHEKHGYPPSYRDIGKRLRLGTTSVKYHVDALVEAGRLRRTGSFSRTLVVVG
jgi:DNA-binding MarR family transcriptional regulator